MKKLLAILLSLTLILTGFTACGSNNDKTAPDQENKSVEQQSEEKSKDKEKEEKKDAEKKDKEDKEDKKDKDADKETAEKPADKDKNNGNSSNSGNKPVDKPVEKPAPKAPKGTPSEIIAKIYANRPVDLKVGTTALDLSSADTVKYVTGLSDASKVKAAAYSEAMMGSQAYSLVVVRAKDKKDTKSIAQAMASGIDQRKWVCVEADDLSVAAFDDLIMLFMVDSALSDTVTSREMVSAFKSVCGGNLDLSI